MRHSGATPSPCPGLALPGGYGADARTGLPITRPDDSFDDPRRHDGRPHPDREPQAARWQTARMLLALLVRETPDRPLEQLWARAWTASLDARVRVDAHDGLAPARIVTDPRAWFGGVLELGAGPRRRLVVRRPGDRQASRPSPRGR